MMSTAIYLDHHATTPVDPRVVEAMLPTFYLHYANPSSISHEMGLDAALLVEDATGTIANALNCLPQEIVFTSGATESNNLAIWGYCFPLSPVISRSTIAGAAPHLITLASEHRAVLDPIEKLEKLGWSVTRLPVIPFPSVQAGLINLEQFSAAIRPETRFVSIMMANNEIGVIQPIAEIAQICRERNIVLHTDATQAVGKIPVDLSALDVDLLSFTAHKFYGPKGVGGLVVKRTGRTIELESQIVGGGQQRNIRSGTLNVSGIVGMATALGIAIKEISEGEVVRTAELRDRLYEQLTQRLGTLPINGVDWRVDSKMGQLRLAGNLNCQFPGCDQDEMMAAVPELMLSGGSACAATDKRPGPCADLLRTRSSTGS
jgi:cysteine desulfurase